MKRLTILSISLLLISCGDDAPSDPTDLGAPDADAASDADLGQPDGADATDATDGADGADGAGGADADADAEEIVDPLVAVPPAEMDSDPLTACPDGYTTDAPEAGQNEGYSAAEQERSFWLALPEQSGPRPLVVSFHGTNGSGEGSVDSYDLGTWVDAGFIVVAPDGNSNGEIWPVWDALRSLGNENLPNPDLDLMDSLIACVAGHYSVDENRLYILGHSAGGIMANHVLRRRDDVLAGGIAASGVYDLTGPDPATELDAMAVLVTWGGSNDAYSGTAEGTTTVPEINFVEQAAVASQAYEAEPNVHQVHCVGQDLGHEWLPISDWMIDYLLSHPLGLPEHNGWTLVRPEEPTVNCRERAAEYTPPVVVECGSATTVADCADYCQFVGDCAVENGTAAPVLGPQLLELGFAGDGYAECGGCITTCEADVLEGGEADEIVAGCMATAAEVAECAGGVEGFLPVVDALNDCCDGAADSELCTRICEALLSNDVARDFFPTCEQWAAE